MAWRSEVMFSMKEITRRLHDVLQDRYGEHVRYDLGENMVLADSGCNGAKSDSLAAVPHLRRWAERLASGKFSAALVDAGLPSDAKKAKANARWAYDQAEMIQGSLWKKGRDFELADGLWRREL